ncbi:Axonemal Inner Arm I1 Intermediate Chain Dynein [Phytophthora infestans T30-4]|uniref:Dynein axonemal intermediate chain 4 n=1 Tax=Phytophthora infestans (strain T30-4) TaxID=403677 RepID=D0P198_PHYIT|nr:Axonemal Inner Arm I1 Intermediate Chain Dynein [Phytophthora infestans T30-4]EEY54122.1 Axonemal Inner Arm I1 Intermediate Chain Dynein [Phytophthora infestans T30-4]|eukprot:XP_002895941.1 Axonemal Inner Arm I1 Intermediate Chain Dynein [Phytophthora infestans T30-4]
MASSARIPVGSSSKQVHGSRRDAAGRSRIIGASSVSNSSRRVNGSVANVNGGAAGHGSGHSTRVYLDGQDVTPQSLLVSRIKTSTESKGRGKGGRHARSKAHVVGASTAGASMAGASFLFSTASTSSADNDSDNESSSSIVGTAGVKAPRKEPKPSIVDHPTTSSVTPSSNQEADENARSAATAGPTDTEDHEQGKGEAGDPLGPVQDAPLLAGRKSVAVATGISPGVRRPITVRLGETATETLFELRSVCVAIDAPDHNAVAARNKRYQAVCAQKKGSDKYVQGRTQTLQLAQKAKEVMTAPPATRDAACVATDWDIYDCGKMEDETNADDEVGGAIPIGASQAQPSSSEGQSRTTEGPPVATGTEPIGGGVGDVQLKQQVEEIVGATLASPGCVLDVDGDIVEDLRARQHRASRPSRKTQNRHGYSSTYSQKSRVFDSQRSTAVATAYVSGNSNASIVLGDQSGGSISAGASQDFAGLTAEGASSGSAATNSQVGMSVANASRGVLSGAVNGSGDQKGNNVYARANTNVDLGEIIARQRTSHVLGSSSLTLMASIVERAVQQNVYHEQHVRYRDFPMLETIETVAEPPNVIVPALDMGFPGTVGSGRSDSFSVGPKSIEELEKLWTFSCELTQNRTVSCLAWNTANEDLLAVSYARNDQSIQPEVPAASPSPANGVQTSGTASNSVSRPGQNSQSAAASTAAVGAGTTGTERDGLVLFWSLTNPEYPERIYQLPVGVTSIDFSTAHPYLLAVGFADGVVSIYDTRKDDSVSCSSASGSALLGVTPTPTARHAPVPIASSSGQSGKHLDAVWQVKWVAHGGSESVVSVSADGRVVEWSLKKGLSYSDLMTLKRAPNPLLGGPGTAATGVNGVGGGTDGVISRQASGRSLAFASQGDPSVYYVGTEDGLVHKCSVSYNEQYLQTYIGHTGPVYQLLISPFCSDLFLSCSGDWSLKLWHQADPHGEATLTFHSVDLAKAVLGASWSPSNAGVFAAVAEDGRIELWDLIQSTLDPVVRHFPKKFISVPVPVTQPTEGDALDSCTRDLTPKERDDDETCRDPNAVEVPATTMVEVPLECTTVAFAPKAPVLIVGDSTGDVTVYRVPAQAAKSAACNGETSDTASHVEDQAARLLRTIRVNKHE